MDYYPGIPSSYVYTSQQYPTGTADDVPVGVVGFLLSHALLSLAVVASGTLSAGQLRCWWFCPWLDSWIRYPDQDLQVAAGANQVWSRLLPALGRVTWLPHGCGAGPVTISIGALIHDR